jgi:peptidoglycan hydrolase-like protein with peptidoglycan-binding domain
MRSRRILREGLCRHGLFFVFRISLHKEPRMPSTLRRGSKGPDVVQLQNLLNSKLSPSPQLSADGDFGKGTEAAVRKFQSLHKLESDGVVGSATWDKLQAKSQAGGSSGDGKAKSGELADTSGLTADQQYDFYVSCLERAPGATPRATKELLAGKRVILGLRVLTNTRANGGKGTYDDRIVVFWNGKDGKHVEEFMANTEPSSRYEDKWGPKKLGQDADDDGRLDLGRIPEGVHTYVKGSSTKYGNILRSAKAITAQRDTNHDGKFNGKDLITNKKNLEVGDFLFHKGGNSMTGSAGCQTMAPAVFEKFWKSLGSQQEFEYVLMEACRTPKQSTSASKKN